MTVAEDTHVTGTEGSGSACTGQLKGLLIGSLKV